VTALAELLAAHRLVDLSLTVAEDLPCSWPTHMPFQHKTYSWFADRPRTAGALRDRTGGGYQTRWLLIDEHTGTHFDAPSHFVPPPDSDLPGASQMGTVTGDETHLEQLIGPAAVIDATDLCDTGELGVSPRIGADRVLAFEREHGRLQPGDVVLLHGGWDRHYRPGPDGEAYTEAPLSGQGPGWPSPDAALVELLAERGVRGLGTDGASIGACDDGRPAHVAGLERGMLYVECLCRLGDLPPRGATFVFLPVKVRGATGGPGRAVAFVPATDA
jgi:isatin hydrolase